MYKPSGRVSVKDAPLRQAKEVSPKQETEITLTPVPENLQEDVKFSDLGISDSLLAVLNKLKLEDPTPIQRKAIPVALAGQDLIGIAQTGTGKTFAYGLPTLQRLGIDKGQALVIAPTRELATQVQESFKTLGQAFGIRTALLIGGEYIDKQLFQIRRKPHVIIATPGRLIDHLARRTLKLEQVKVLILDEADMMLDMGFAPQIKEILKQAPTDRQTLLFSATMPATILNLAATFMKLPVSIEVAPPGTTAAQVDQEIFIINPDDRLSHLLKVLAFYKGSVLVFVRTKHGVKNLTAKLQGLGHKAVEIHSNLSLNRRRQALDSFKSKRERIMVATDVAARGLDVSGIELVVNFNLPDNSDDYVHRIGRTGRAGQPGKAITFATPNERREIKEIERLINREIKQTAFAREKENRPTVVQSKDYRRGSESRTEQQSAPSRRRRPAGNYRARGANQGSSRPGSSRPSSSRPNSSRPGSSRPNSSRPGSSRPSSSRPGPSRPSSSRPGSSRPSSSRPNSSRPSSSSPNSSRPNSSRPGSSRPQSSRPNSFRRRSE